MKVLPKFKRGDTLILSCRSYHMDGETQVDDDLTGVTIRSQIRNGKRLLAEAVVSKADQTLHAGEFSLTIEPSVTQGFPAARLEQDIQMSVGGVVLSSETFILPVELDVTYD